MKRYTTILAALLFSASLFSQENYLITTKGEKRIILGDDIRISGQSVAWVGEKGKFVYQNTTKIESMMIYGAYYKRLPSFPKYGPHLIVAYNDKYILTKVMKNGYDYFVFDRELNNVAKNFRLLNEKKRFDKEMEKSVLPYFDSCSELIEALNENFKNGKEAFFGLYHINCGGEFPFKIE